MLQADEVVADPQLAAGELSDLLDVRQIGPTAIRRYFPPEFGGRGFPARGPDPGFGEHTVEALVEAGMPEPEAAAIAAEQVFVDFPPGLWWRPEIVAAREQEFGDYLALGSVLRIDPGVPAPPQSSRA